MPPVSPAAPKRTADREFPRYIFKLEAAKALVEAHVQKRLAPLDPWQHVGRMTSPAGEEVVSVG